MQAHGIQIKINICLVIKLGLFTSMLPEPIASQVATSLTSFYSASVRSLYSMTASLILMKRTGCCSYSNSLKWILKKGGQGATFLTYIRIQSNLNLIEGIYNLFLWMYTLNLVPYLSYLIVSWKNIKTEFKRKATGNQNTQFR